MKRYKWALGFMAIALILGIGFMQGNKAEAGDGLKLGSKAPMADVKMTATDGKTYTITSVKGKHGTLVIFSCNACPWVKNWEDRISEIGNAYQEKGVGVIVINANDPSRVPEDSYDEMVKRAKDKGFAFPYVVDETSDIAREFGATRTPEVFLFDAEGSLVYHGAIDDNAADAKAVEAHYLKEALNAIVAGKPVPMAETKALGCTVKLRRSDS